MLHLIPNKRYFSFLLPFILLLVSPKFICFMICMFRVWVFFQLCEQTRNHLLASCILCSQAKLSAESVKQSLLSLGGLFS